MINISNIKIVLQNNLLSSDKIEYYSETPPQVHHFIILPPNRLPCPSLLLLPSTPSLSCCQPNFSRRVNCQINYHWHRVPPQITVFACVRVLFFSVSLLLGWLLHPVALTRLRAVPQLIPQYCKPSSTFLPHKHSTILLRLPIDQSREQNKSSSQFGAAAMPKDALLQANICMQTRICTATR
mgnify:CR=1 FL=1